MATATATSALMGNSIGANNIPLAKRFFALTWKINLLITVILAVSMILAGR